jgi:hypothetical protein
MTLDLEKYDFIDNGLESDQKKFPDLF